MGIGGYFNESEGTAEAIWAGRVEVATASHVFGLAARRLTV
jgi:hypothetical protein